MVIQNHHRWVSSKKWGIPSRHHGFQYEVVQWSNAKYQPQMNSSGLLMRVGLPQQIVIHYCFKLEFPIDQLAHQK